MLNLCKCCSYYRNKGFIPSDNKTNDVECSDLTCL
jgi:hypothetical protein